MNGSRCELHAERMEQLENGLIARFGARRKRFVETFAPKAGIFGELCHAARASDIPHGGQKHIGVGIFKRRSKVFGDAFFIVEIIGRIEWGKLNRVISMSWWR